jgi:hypothetical protein
MTTNLEERGPCPVFASFTLTFASQMRKKHGKTSVGVRKTSVIVQSSKYLSQRHVLMCITLPTNGFSFSAPSTQTKHSRLQRNRPNPCLTDGIARRNASERNYFIFFWKALVGKETRETFNTAEVLRSSWEGLSQRGAPSLS